MAEGRKEVRNKEEPSWYSFAAALVYSRMRTNKIKIVRICSNDHINPKKG